jgi:TPR repeat protein
MARKQTVSDGRKSSDDLFLEADKQWDAGNLKDAFRLFSIAAERGNAAARVNLGYFFNMGIGTSRNESKAIFWYKKAARKGDVCAYTNIGTIYRDYNNFERARFWFLKAIENGDGDAALELGKLYLLSQKPRRLVFAEKYFYLTLQAKNVTQMSKEEAERLLRKIKLR